MVYRKGELSKHQVDRGWPHQVEVHADVCAGPNNSVVHDFCRGLSVCPRGGRGGWKEDGWYLATPSAAPPTPISSTSGSAGGG